jgi:hypothetical protein
MRTPGGESRHARAVNLEDGTFAVAATNQERTGEDEARMVLGHTRDGERCRMSPFLPSVVSLLDISRGMGNVYGAHSPTLSPHFSRDPRLSFSILPSPHHLFLVAIARIPSSILVIFPSILLTFLFVPILFVSYQSNNNIFHGF